MENDSSGGASLTDLELRSLQDAKEQYPSLPPDLVSNVRVLFHNSRTIGATIIAGINGEIFQGHLVLAHIIRRTQELLLGGLQQITYGNRYLTAVSLRGVIETFGAIAWVSEKPERLPNLVNEEGIGVGKLVNVAYRRNPGLKKDYAQLSNWIHPRKDSFYTGVKIVSPSNHFIHLSVQLEPFTSIEADATLGAIAEGAHMIQEDVKNLITAHPEVLRSGRVFARTNT